MAAKQTRLLDVMKQFKDEAQDLVKKTQSQVQDLVVKTTNDIAKLAVNNPKIKNVVKKLESEQKRYERVFEDLQDRALKLYKDRAESTVSDIKSKIESYRKQAERLYKDATVKKQTAAKPAKKIKVKAKAKKAKKQPAAPQL